MIDLVAGRSDLLPVIAVPADERDEDNGQLQIGTGTCGIPGQHPEPGCIGVHLGADRDLDRKVGDVGPRQERLDRGFGSAFLGRHPAALARLLARQPRKPRCLIQRKGLLPLTG